MPLHTGLYKGVARSSTNVGILKREKIKIFFRAPEEGNCIIFGLNKITYCGTGIEIRSVLFGHSTLAPFSSRVVDSSCL